MQRYPNADARIYSNSETHTNTRLETGSHWENSWRGLPYWARVQAAFFSRKTSHPHHLPQQAPKSTLLLLYMKYGTKMNYTQHLLIWHAKYTRLVQQNRSFCDGTPVPPVWHGSDASFRCPHWIILPECIIDTFNLSCRSMFDLSLQASQAGCIIECSLWFVSV